MGGAKAGMQRQPGGQGAPPSSLSVSAVSFIMADAALAKPVARKASAADPKADPAVPKSSISGAASGVPLFCSIKIVQAVRCRSSNGSRTAGENDQHPTGSSIEANSGSVQGAERRIGFQAKLVVKQPGDLFEREADAPGSARGGWAIQCREKGKCANCEPGKPCAECAQQGEEQLLQRKPVETASVSSLPISAR